MKTAKFSLLTGVALATCAMSAFPAAGIQPQHTRSSAPPLTVLAITSQMSVRYSHRWSESPLTYGNARELVRFTNPAPGAKTVEPLVPSARLLITTEKRSSQADARQRLLDIAHTRPVAPVFYSISGWPAVEIRFKQPLPRTEAEPAEARKEPQLLVQRAVVAIAVGQQVVGFDLWLGQGVPDAVLEEAIAIARSASLPGQERPEALRRILQGLRRSVRESKPRRPPGNLPVTGTLPGNSTPRGFQLVHPDPPTLLPQPGTSGELEIASDDVGQNIVIAANQSSSDASGLSFSTDYGTTFSSGSTPFSDNDPTLARGLSNHFYLGSIVTTPTGPVAGCNDAIARSNDNTGANFSQQGFSALCAISGPTLCFPDQPHIAADRSTSRLRARTRCMPFGGSLSHPWVLPPLAMRPADFPGRSLR